MNLFICFISCKMDLFILLHLKLIYLFNDRTTELINAYQNILQINNSNLNDNN